MASQKTGVEIINKLNDEITLGISEVCNYDWDGNSRPDHNLAGKQISTGQSLCEREEINYWANECWYRLHITLPTGLSFSQRINQRLARSEGNHGTNVYFLHNHKYLISLKSINNDSKYGCCLQITISINDEPLPQSMLEFSTGAVPTDSMGWLFQHTYAFTKKDNAYRNFQCWGGVDHNVVHRTCKGDLELATAIACFDPYDIRVDYNKHAGEFNIFNAWFGDCSGIVYGVTGVCHQMTNRVLYACDGKPEVFDFTPSAKLSYAAYGIYGHHLLTGSTNWLAYLSECERMVRQGRALPNASMDIQEAESYDVRENLLAATEDMDAFAREAIRIEIEYLGDDDLPNRRLDLLLKTAFPQGYDAKKKDLMFEKNSEFHSEKANLVASFGGSTNDFKTKEDLLRFADEINPKHAKLLLDFQSVLGDTDFELLFGIPYSSNFKLVNKNFINEAY